MLPLVLLGTVFVKEMGMCILLPANSAEKEPEEQAGGGGDNQEQDLA